MLTSQVTISANGCTLIFVYMTYTMLPVRLREALLGGLVLSAVHIYMCVHTLSEATWQQVRADTRKYTTVRCIPNPEWGRFRVTMLFDRVDRTKSKQLSISLNPH